VFVLSGSLLEDACKLLEVGFGYHKEKFFGDRINDAESKPYSTSQTTSFM